jgi:hypothetical protein
MKLGRFKDDKLSRRHEFTIHREVKQEDVQEQQKITDIIRPAEEQKIEADDLAFKYEVVHDGDFPSSARYARMENSNGSGLDLLMLS